MQLGADPLGVGTAVVLGKAVVGHRAGQRERVLLQVKGCERLDGGRLSRGVVLVERLLGSVADAEGDPNPSHAVIVGRAQLHGDLGRGGHAKRFGRLDEPDRRRPVGLDPDQVPGGVEFRAVPSARLNLIADIPGERGKLGAQDGTVDCEGQLAGWLSLRTGGRAPGHPGRPRHPIENNSQANPRPFGDAEVRLLDHLRWLPRVSGRVDLRLERPDGEWVEHRHPVGGAGNLAGDDPVLEVGPDVLGNRRQGADQRDGTPVRGRSRAQRCLVPRVAGSPPGDAASGPRRRVGPSVSRGGRTRPLP